MFKGFHDGFSLVNDDLETIFSNGLDSNCNYNIKLVLSDIHNLMTKYKNEKKNILSSVLQYYLTSYYYLIFVTYTTLFMISEKVEQGEFNRKFPDAVPTYSENVDVKKLRFLLKKIEYFFSWVDRSIM